MTRTIRIGGASGFWGDSMIGAPQLLEGGRLDYLVFDYLAEITMSIMARARASDPEQGYATDFVHVTMKQALREIARQGVKVISNAGGVNPRACARAIEGLIADQGLSLKVAVVTGDDLMDHVPEIEKRGITEMFSGTGFPKGLMSVNAYLGGFPIAKALAEGADIVVTGRCVDSAVTLGACIHAFGWRDDQLDRLAGGSLAGHIIECGAQATGGTFTDWHQVEDWANIGYPIAEMSEDGSFVVSKPPGTGGMVTPATVGEQMIYEIGDPQAYVLPDVVCDFSEVKIEQVGPDLVRVSNARGREPTDTYKVSATYQDGWRLGLYLTIGGIDADLKAEKMAAEVFKRCRQMLRARNQPDFKETSVEVIGAEASYGPNRRVQRPREVVLKMAAKHDDPKVLASLLREATSTGTSMSPGTTGMGGNRPKPMPIVRLFSFLFPKTDVVPKVHMGDATWEVPARPGRPLDRTSLSRPIVADAAVDGPAVEVPLVALAWGRSGDKGNNANVGLMARKAEYLPHIRAALTPEAVGHYYRHILDGKVERFDLPGINGLNFLLHDILGGGGTASLRNDPQGKAYAQMLLDFPVPVPKALAERDGLEAA
jgi:hypothetical protein